MKPNCTVTLHHQGERPQTFDGTIIKESSTHYLVKHESKDSTGEGAEWFPKNSRACSAIKHKQEGE